MSSSPVFYLLKPERVEPASSMCSWLGRIVQNHAAPDANFTPTAPARLLHDITLSETKIANASAFVDNATNDKLELELTGLASHFRARGKGSGVEFSATSIRYCRLQNHEKALEAILKDVEVKEDLRKMLKPGGEPSYFIVGMLIWENATFVDERSASTGMGGSVELPVSIAVGATTGVVIPDINPGVAAESEAVQKRTLAGFSEGSSIFAFEYRTVRRRVYSITANFTPRLGGYGGRIEKDRVFGNAAPQQDDEPMQEEGPVVMDDDDGISWADLVEEELEIERFCDLSVAFD
ncbi:MAG: hypothetical protein L6R38_007577 [Xanthoria sp. 2 TBL-2021]|nr:MAG: hypothetical protein L6R38_007577 [Xanthoria sp. 2 TBL-2021]